MPKPEDAVEPSRKALKEARQRARIFKKGLEREATKRRRLPSPKSERPPEVEPKPRGRGLRPSRDTMVRPNAEMARRVKYGKDTLVRPKYVADELRKLLPKEPPMAKPLVKGAAKTGVGRAGGAALGILGAILGDLIFPEEAHAPGIVQPERRVPPPKRKRIGKTFRYSPTIDELKRGQLYKQYPLGLRKGM